MIKATNLLRYPGGKNRAINKILPLIPDTTKTLYSPFFGGGSIEFNWLANNPDNRVIARDIFPQLVNFWEQVLSGNQYQVADIASSFIGLNKITFSHLQNNLRSSIGTKTQLAAWFYVINRASFSGATLSGGMGDGTRFNESAIDRLATFEHAGRIQLQHADVFDSIRRRTDRFSDDTCIYLDPPYLLKVSNLYGNKGDTHAGFNHTRLKDILTKLNNQGVKWILSYNDSLAIREFYKDFRLIPKYWKYGMSSDKNGKELIVLSDNI